MPGEAGFEVARAYVVIEPDAAGFPEKLKRDLESYKFDLKIPVSPDSAGFREKLQADLNAEKGDEVRVGVEPDAGGFREKLAAAVSGPEKPVEIPVDPELGGFEAKVLAALALMKRDLADSSGDLMMQTGLLDQMAVALGIIQRDTADTSADLMMQTGLLRDIRDLLGQNAAMAALYATAMGKATESTAGAGQAARTAGQAFRIWGTGIQVGQLALHGLISGLVELAAVVIPATVAAGAWAAVWSEGAQQVGQHLSALNTATQATQGTLGKTTSQVLGLGNALANAQDKARPQVYEALGAALNLVKEQSGSLIQAGLQMGTVFDQFAAKVVTDFSKGGTLSAAMHSVTSGMVGDLTGLGQVAGNVGHALLGLAGDMPGLAAGMLGVLSWATRMVADLTTLHGALGSVTGDALKFALALHEFNVWGSVANAALVKMGLSTTTLTGGFASYLVPGGRFIGILKSMIGLVPNVGFGIAALASKVPVLGEKIVGTTAAVDESKAAFAGWLADLGAIPTLGIAAAAAAVGFLVYKIVTAKDATAQWIASMQAMILAAPVYRGITVLASAQADVTTRLTGAQQRLTQSVRDYGAASEKAIGGAASRYQSSYNPALDQAATKVVELTNYQQKLTDQTSLYDYRLGRLAASFGSTSAAMGIMTAAGITMKQMLDKNDWAQIAQQVNAMVQGFQAMGQKAGVLGADMNALTISASSQVSSMSKLNQAWDTTIGIVSGGQGSFISFEQSVAGVGTAAKAAGASMNGLNAPSLSLRAAWQNAYAGGAKLIDALRMMSSMTPGGFPSITRAVKDTIDQMMGVGKQSAATRAEMVSLADEVNPNIKNFQDLTTWLGHTKNAGSDLNAILSKAGVNVQDLTADAAKLSDVIQNAVISKFQLAKMSADGTNAAISNLATAIGHNASASTIAGDSMTLFAKLTRDGGYSAQAAAALVSSLTGRIFKVPKGWKTTFSSNASQQSAEIRRLQRQIESLHGKTIDVKVMFSTGGSATFRNTGSSLPGGYPGAPGASAGAVIPGYAPGVDDRLIAVGPGEGVLVPEAVRGLGGPAFVHAANRKFGGARVARGNKTGAYASGGVTGSAQFAYPTDVFNFAITDNIAGWPGSPWSGAAGGSLAGELRSGKTAKAAEQAGQAIAKAFASGTLNTVSAIKSEADKAVSAIRQYYSGPAATRLIATIRAQSASMEKLAAASAKVSATISAMKSYASQETSSLASGFSDLSNIQAPTSASGATQPVTGAYIKSQLQGDLATLRRFFKIIGELKKDSLGKTLISQVIALGPVAGIQYGEAILSGGKGLISQLNKIETAIGGEEKLIGQRSAEIQYGQSISKGFLSGLDKQKAELARRMRDLGDEIARELAKALGVPLRDLPKLGGGSGGHHGRPGPIVHRGPHARPGPIVHHGGGARAHPAHEAKKVEVHSTINVHGTKLSAEDLATIRHMIAQAVSVA